MKNNRENSIIETSGGIKIYPLQVEAFPQFFAYAYLVKTNDMLALIDTGSGSLTSNESLQHEIEKNGYRLSEITHIFLTHGHIDHYGGLVFLKKHTGALIHVHEQDYNTIAHHEERLALMSHRINDFLSEAGVRVEEREHLLSLYKFTKALYRSVPVDVIYNDVGMQVADFSFIHVPGHCPGHVAIKVDDVIFSGDNILKNIMTHQSPERLTPYTGIRHYLDTLSKLETWSQDARLILAGHDQPLPQVTDRSAQIKQHLEKRLCEVLEETCQPKTIQEITSRVYGEVAGYNELLILEKTGAYVEYLYHRGFMGIENIDEVERNPGTAAIRYRCLTERPCHKILPKENDYVFV